MILLLLSLPFEREAQMNDVDVKTIIDTIEVANMMNIICPYVAYDEYAKIYAVVLHRPPSNVM